MVRHPERETRAGSRVYALRLGVDPYGWLILSGSEMTTGTLRDQFGHFGSRPSESSGDTRGRVYLVDSAGRLRQVYPAGAFQVGVVLADMERLL